ncbi:glycosyltransferase family 1 protein [Ectothiorhodospiraceae bacterium 2226]|nr:glycosyltransferase family 1 protein [Ectothiorhodospiraceae bacterium 2226]
MLDINVYPDTHPRHSSPIYAGLFELEHRGEARVGFFRRRPLALRDESSYAGHTLWLEVADSVRGIHRRVCFDMEDSHAYNALDRLDACDVYFKRSYSRGASGALAPRRRAKILPYGLYAPCSSPHERGLVARAWHYRRQHAGTAAALRAAAAAMRTRYLRWRRPQAAAHYPYPFMQRWAEPQEGSSEPVVLFQTRVWDPAEWAPVQRDEVARLNHERAEIVRALRRSLGPRFVGGLAPSPYAAAHYADCLTERSTSRAGFMQLVKGSSVAVTSTGLHRSIGARLAEYVAAGRAIVTEALPCELPVPLIEERNLLSFDDTDGCVAACVRLLEERDLADRMRAANRRYYMAQLEPAAHMRRCLEQALARVPGAVAACAESY